VPATNARAFGHGLPVVALRHDGVTRGEEVCAMQHRPLDVPLPQWVWQNIEPE
jgi:hypothetical protein